MAKTATRLERSIRRLRHSNSRLQERSASNAGGDDDEDDAAESISPAIEIYAPIRKDDAILAVSEIYLPVASIATELRNANVLNWLLLGSWVVLTMSVLFDIVHDGSETIEKQKSRLTGQIRDLTTLLDQNEGLRRQLQDKTAEAALIHERILQKVSADLHDGPAQLLTFQLLRLNKLAPTIESTMGATGLDELRRLRAAIADTLTEVRAISSGLALPGSMETSLVETLELAITQHFEQTSTSVIFECDDAARQCPPLSLPMKTCLYRLVQEALNNAFRHGGGIGQKVEVTMGVELRVAISNTGPGIGQEPAKTGLGILGMRSRVEALGGVFEIISHGDAGTEVIARFDINEHLDGVLTGVAKKMKVAVIDDHAVVRRGVSETFAEQADFEVVAEGASAQDAVRIAREKAPGLFVLDVTMPGGGVEAVAQIMKVCPKAAILMLSIREDLATIRAALQAGAGGYISKGVDSDDLVAAARKVVAGERYVSADLAARLLLQDDLATGIRGTSFATIVGA